MGLSHSISHRSLWCLADPRLADAADRESGRPLGLLHNSVLMKRAEGSLLINARDALATQNIACVED